MKVWERCPPCALVRDDQASDSERLKLRSKISPPMLPLGFGLEGLGTKYIVQLLYTIKHIGAREVLLAGPRS